MTCSLVVDGNEEDTRAQQLLDDSVLPFWLKEKRPDQLKSFLSPECQAVWNPEVCLHSFWNCILKPRSLGTSFPDSVSHSICPACHRHFFITWNWSPCFHMVVVALHPGYEKHIYFPLPHNCTSMCHIRILFVIRSPMHGLDTRVTVCNWITVFTIIYLNEHYFTEIIKSSRNWGIPGMI